MKVVFPIIEGKIKHFGGTNPKTTYSIGTVIQEHILPDDIFFDEEDNLIVLKYMGGLLFLEDWKIHEVKLTISNYIPFDYDGSEL